MNKQELYTQEQYNQSVQDVLDVKDKLKTVENQLKKIIDKNTVLSTDLVNKQKKLLLQCGHCNNYIPVKNVELIIKYHNGYLDGDDDWTYQEDKFWVCTHCNTVLDIPTDPIYSHFELDVKIIHKWYSDRERLHGRILELLKPHLDKEEAEKNRKYKEQQIKAAQELLRKEGLI